MHEHDEKHNPDVLEGLGYEPRDLELSKLPKGAVGFFIAVTVTFAAAYVFMRVVAPEQVNVPKDATANRRLPNEPNPLLQSNVTTKKDIADLRALEERKLNTYGWVDKQKGIVHIPVEKAIEMTAQRVKTAGSAR